MAFCSGLTADEATAEAAKTSILTRLHPETQGFLLNIQWNSLRGCGAMQVAVRAEFDSCFKS
jgi:hypothetical protein